MYNIVTVTFKDSNTATANGVRQWDYGQILRIQGLQLPTAVEVHFALIDSKDSVTRIGITKDGVTDVVIPDSMIEAGKNIFAYVYLRDSESGQTEYEIKIVVTTRAKPEAFDTPEDKELFAQAIEAVNEAADRAEKAGQAATEAAGQAAEDAQQTAEDRKEVAKMVETASDISEQVKKVEELSNKVQEAATKTGQDAQQTAEDRVEVGKMLETVRDVSEQVKSVEESVRKAKKSEQAAAGHRTAVEEMKNSVEQTASTFPQKVQEGVQAIENAGASEVQEITQAGTAQKTAVEAAGTQAVESVENVQQVATEAVETAKAEAVQSVQTEGTKQTGNVSAEGAKQIKEVQDKGAEVLQSIPEDFTTQMETKLNKQQGIENKGKALVIGEDGLIEPREVASGGGDGIAIINTMSGESPLVIPDSAERVNKRLELGGKTEQVQTTGKNLLPDKFSIYAEGKSKTNLKLQIGNYVYSSKTSKNLYILHEDKSNITNGWTATNKFNFKIDKEETIEVRIETENPLEILPMIREETELDSYEPYTGGKPSPSPEYPQEIKNAGKWNEETQKYEVEISISGRNLFDFSTCEEGKIFEGGGNIASSANGLLTDFIPCFPNSQYSRSRTGFTVVAFYDCNKNKIGFELVGDSTFITPQKCRYFRYSINKAQVDYEKLVACPGNTVMEYEPYYHKPIFLTLTSDRPITKWDRLVEQGGQIGWLYATKKHVVTGSEHFIRGGVNYYTGSSVDLYFNVMDATGSQGIVKNLSDVPSIWHNEDAEGFRVNGSQFHIRLKNTRLSVSDDATKDEKIAAYKTYLVGEHEKGTPYEIVYQSLEPEFVPLPQSEQNAIRALKTYYPTTVITVDGGEVDTDIKVTYTADTKNYIDGKVSAKVASILRQYQADTANLLSLMPMETQATMIENDTNNILNNLESEEAHE